MQSEKTLRKNNQEFQTLIVKQPIAYMNTLYLSILLSLVVNISFAQTKRETISDFRQMSITRTITEADTTFYFMGQNGKYMHITDLVSVKAGSASEINSLLTECVKFLPQADGSSIDFNGNTLMVLGKKKLMVYGEGGDSGKFVVLDGKLIARLQSDLQPYLK